MQIPKTKYIGLLIINKNNNILKIKKSEYFEKDKFYGDDIEVIYNRIDNKKYIFSYKNLYKIMTIYGVVYIYDWEETIYGFGNNQLGIQLAILDYYKTSEIYENMHNLIGDEEE